MTTDASANAMETIDHADGPVRRLLLGLILLGALGLLAELILLEHFESWQQWVPLTALALALVSGVAAVVRPTRGVVRAFRLIMLLHVVAGAVGIWLHYEGNTAFELEQDPAAQGLVLLWRSLRGATPTLAPGALAQLGLLGLIYTFRHPAIHAQERT